MSTFGELENVIMVMLTNHVYDFAYYRFFCLRILKFLVSMFNILHLLMQNIYIYVYIYILLFNSLISARRLTVYKILPS